MLGELNLSHTRFGTFGDDENLSLTNVTVDPGIVFESNSPFTVKRTINRGSAYKKGITIQPGDLLIKVNGEDVNPAQYYAKYFTQPSANREMKLTFKNAQGLYDVNIHLGNSIGGKLYKEWIDATPKRVDEKSSNKIAYTHIKDMGGGKLNTLLMDMARNFIKRIP